MEQSDLSMTTKVQMLDARLSLVHIPLSQYQSFLPTILKLLFPTSTSVAADSASLDKTRGCDGNARWANQHVFFNVSVTPIECSIICSRQLAESCFASPIAERPNKADDRANTASISAESYLFILVESEGTEAGQRVLELTSPLALAGIPLFFVTTYFSDYILVPSEAKARVVRALEEQGFAFEQGSEAYVNPSALHHRHASSTSSFETNILPSTPPPTTIAELQAHTFALLNKRSIVPRVDQDVRLLQCAGRSGDGQNSGHNEMGLQMGLTKCLLHQPKFLSLTLTQTEPASMLLEKRLLPCFNVGTDSVLLNRGNNELVPITLDLEALPFEATGIVCGVAGRLVGGHGTVQPIEMSYLSTAKTGTVMVDEKELESALRALRVGDDGRIEP